MKVVINACFGGFSLSPRAVKRLAELNGRHTLPSGRELERHDPKLIQVIEELGAGHGTGASGICAELRIVEIPDGTDYEIEEYDGKEHIAERHNTWR